MDYQPWHQENNTKRAEADEIRTQQNGERYSQGNQLRQKTSQPQMSKTRASLFIAVGVGLFIGLAGLTGYTRVKLSRAVENLISENPEAFCLIDTNR